MSGKSNHAEMLDAVGYEIEMLAATAQVLSYVGSPSALGFAVLESHLIHVRNLVEFFYIGKKNLRADLFVEAWDELRPDGNEALGEDVGRLYGDLSDKLAHIGGGRITPRGWSPQRLSNGLIHVATVWVRNLPSAQQDTLFDSRPSLRGLLE